MPASLQCRRSIKRTKKVRASIRLKKLHSWNIVQEGAVTTHGDVSGNVFSIRLADISVLLRHYFLDFYLLFTGFARQHCDALVSGMIASVSWNCFAAWMRKISFFMKNISAANSWTDFIDLGKRRFDSSLRRWLGVPALRVAMSCVVLIATLTAVHPIYASEVTSPVEYQYDL